MRTIFLPIVIISVVFLVGVVILVIFFRDRIDLSITGLIASALNFFIALATWFISFGISEVYWKNRLEKEQSYQAIKQLVYSLNLIGKLVVETNGLLNRSFEAYQHELSVARDAEVIANLRRFGDCAANTNFVIEMHFVHLARTPIVSAQCQEFQSKILPLLKQLSEIPQIRPNPDEVKVKIIKLGGDLERILRVIKSSYTNQS